MTLFRKDRRESHAAWNHWNERFGHFENLHGVRQSIWEITEIVQAAARAGAPRNLYECANRFEQHAKAQRQLAEDARTLSGLLQAAWTGDAAATARSKFDSFVRYATETASTLDGNAMNLEGQAKAFADLASTMKPLPDIAETQQWLFSRNSWTKEFLANWEFEQGRVHIAQENLGAYEGYNVQTQDNIGKVKVDYGDLPAIAGDVKTTAPVDVPGGHSESSTLELDGYSSSPWDTDGLKTGPWVAGGSPRPSWDTGGADYSGTGTRAAGYIAPSTGSAVGAGGFGPTGAGFGPSGAGTDAGFGPGGRGAGGAIGGGPGAGGRATGVAPPGGGARAAGLGGGMPRGGPGAMGMGGAPAGGAGRGGDDEEYQSRGILQEEDPDSLFGITESTVPPVIGDDWE